eukprot:1663334-Amphidinium_carterae.1
MTDEHDREEVGVHELVIEQAHMMHQANDGDDASTEVDTFEKDFVTLSIKLRSTTHDAELNHVTIASCMQQ